MADNRTDKPSTHDLDSLWADIASIRIGMVTTLDGDVLRSRPVLTCPDCEEGAIYFFTRSKDHKILEIRQDRRTCIAFVDRGREIYISVSGKALVLSDREKERKYSTPEAIAWFENGTEDESLRLIRLHLDQAERWDVTKNPIRKVWEIARSMNTSHMPELSENAKFRFTT